MNEVRRHSVGWFQPQPPELIEQTIAELRAWVGADAPTPNEADRPMAIDDLTAWLGSAPTAVAYPFGVWGVDVDLEVAEAARAAGYKLGVVYGRGPEQADPMLLARKSPPGD